MTGETALMSMKIFDKICKKKNLRWDLSIDGDPEGEAVISVNFYQDEPYKTVFAPENTPEKARAWLYDHGWREYWRSWSHKGGML